MSIPSNYYDGLSNNKALIRAVQSGDSPSVLKFIQLGADVNVRDDSSFIEGNTPLMYAIRSGRISTTNQERKLDFKDAKDDLEVVKVLLQNGAKYTEKEVCDAIYSEPFELLYPNDCSTPLVQGFTQIVNSINTVVQYGLDNIF